MRDVLLGQVPAALDSNGYLPVATASASSACCSSGLFHRLRHLITVLDALTIGLFEPSGPPRRWRSGCPRSRRSSSA
ncbi:MAG: hypothetical protein R2717_07840 [Schumannella sp.]